MDNNKVQDTVYKYILNLQSMVYGIEHYLEILQVESFGQILQCHECQTLKLRVVYDRYGRNKLEKKINWFAFTEAGAK